MSTVNQFMLGNVKTLNSSSIQPAVSMSHEYVVAVFRDSSTEANDDIRYKFGTINGLGILNWGDLHTVGGSGNTPTVGINDQGVVVEVREASGELWAHVGGINTPNKTVDWGGALDTHYTGYTPAASVAYINSQHIVVVAYVASSYSNIIHFLIGKVNYGFKSSTVEWTLLTDTLEGYNPKIAINNNKNLVLLTNDDQGTIKARVGQLNSSLNGIGWEPISTDIAHNTTGYGAVSMSPDGFLAFAYQGQSITNVTSWGRNSMSYPSITRSGTLNADKTITTWPDLYGPGLGKKPAIATNGTQVVMIQETPLIENEDERKVVFSSSTIRTICTDRANWMANYPSRTLKELVIPGAHDAGMSQTNYCTNTASLYPTNDTITQSLDFYNMLGNGIRYFDVRPGWLKKNSSDNNPETWTGHFSDSLGGVGCLGRKMLNKSTDNNSSLPTVFDDVLRFLSAYPRGEVIILKFSHYLMQTQRNNLVDHTDIFKYTDNNSINTFKPRIQQLIQDVVDVFGNWLYQKPADKGSLENITLQEITSTGSKVIALFDFVELPTMKLSDMFPNNTTVLSSVYSYADYYLDSHHTQPVMSGCDLTVYDHYSNTDDVEVMVAYKAPDDTNHPGQRYLYLQPDNHRANLYLLSWTLTQSTTDIAMGQPAITQLAQQANCCLGSFMQKLIQESSIPLNGNLLPNIIYVDLCTHFVTDVCNYINAYLHPHG